MATQAAEKQVLTYIDGHFLLTTSYPRGMISGRVPLKDAKQYAEFADAKALKVLNRAFVKQYRLPIRSFPSHLDPHQMDGVDWILSRSRSYLAHAPGAGKTCEAITAACLAEGEGQVVFIVPPSLTANWAREIKKFSLSALPSMTIIPDSLRKDRVNWNAKIIIVPDSMLQRPWVMEGLTKVKKLFVAVDEASRFKEPQSQRTIALFGGHFKDGRKSPGLVYQAKHAVLLDGSPMPNRPMELWAPTYAMNPECIDFMSQSEFGFKFCGPKMNSFGRWEFKGASNQEELRERLQKNFMHVVPESVLPHPERKRSMLFMSEDVRSPEHKAWEKSNLSSINLAALGDDMGQGDIARYRQELGMRKVPWIINYVKERLKGKNESILLFAWHREVCIALAKGLEKFSPGLVMGGTAEDIREDYFSEFQSGRNKLIIGNIAAMGRGFNLQRADRIIFAEFSWCGETNTQCEKRASRRGSTKSSIRCEYVVSPESMDEVVLSSVFRKDATVKKVIG